jgi:hypothetical protein
VGFEPVSRTKFPDNREKYREIHRYRRLDGRSTDGKPPNRGTSHAFPYAQEQGFRFAITGKVACKTGKDIREISPVLGSEASVSSGPDGNPPFDAGLVKTVKLLMGLCDRFRRDGGKHNAILGLMLQPCSETHPGFVAS